MKVALKPALLSLAIWALVIPAVAEARVSLKVFAGAWKDPTGATLTIQENGFAYEQVRCWSRAKCWSPPVRIWLTLSNPHRIDSGFSATTRVRRAVVPTGTARAYYTQELYHVGATGQFSVHPHEGMYRLPILDDLNGRLFCHPWAMQECLPVVSWPA